MRTNGAVKAEPQAIAQVEALAALEDNLADLGLGYGPCWVTLLDEDDNELPVIRRVARMVHKTSTEVIWSQVHFIAPVNYALGADRRRPRIVYAAASGTPCGKAYRLGSIAVRPDELVSITPKVSANS
jgi:hypothetical protein